jgi:hypothetical protein
MAKRRQGGSALIIKTLALPESEVRTTPDKRVAVYDTVKAVTGAKNPHQVWNDMKKQYPEVLQKTENFKFPGRGQRSTPVTNKEGLVYVLSLLPGTVGHEIREDAAALIVRYIEGDATLAEEIIDRQDDPEQLQRIALRAKGKQARSLLTRTIQAHGGEGGTQGPNTYRTASSMFNRAITQHSSKEIQTYTGEAATRDGLPSIHLTMFMMGEELLAHTVKREHIYGHAALVETSGKIAKTMEALCREYGVPPFPPTKE